MDEILSEGESGGEEPGEGREGEKRRGAPAQVKSTCPPRTVSIGTSSVTRPFDEIDSSLVFFAQSA